MLEEVLAESKKALVPEPEALLLLSTTISVCMNDEDGDLYNEPITRKEMLRARQMISKLDKILAAAIARVEESQRSASDEAARSDEPDVRQFLTEEAEGAASYARKARNLRNGLDPLRVCFELPTKRPETWHRHATRLYWVSKGTMEAKNPGMAWGVSPDGPAVRFVRIALKEILARENGDGSVTSPVPTGRAIAEVLTKDRNARNGRIA